MNRLASSAPRRLTVNTTRASVRGPKSKVSCGSTVSVAVRGHVVEAPAARSACPPGTCRGRTAGDVDERVAVDVGDPVDAFRGGVVRARRPRDLVEVDRRVRLDPPLQDLPGRHRDVQVDRDGAAAAAGRVCSKHWRAVGVITTVTSSVVGPALIRSPDRCRVPVIGTFTVRGAPAQGEVARGAVAVGVQAVDVDVSARRPV